MEYGPRFSKDSWRQFMRGVAVGALSVALVVVFFERVFQTVSFVPVSMDVVQERVAQRAARLLGQVVWNMESMFYRDLNDADIPAMINGVVSAIDAHGGYVPAERVRSLSGRPLLEEREAWPYRIGIWGAPLDDVFVIETVAPGGPADRAGVEPGDVLVGVGDRRFEGGSGRLVFDALLEVVETGGGRPIRLVLRRGEEEVQVEVVAERLPPYFAFDLGRKEGVQHIAVVGFYPGAVGSLRTIVQKAVDTGAVGVVLDVRANAGGRVDEALAMLGLFAPRGTLAFIRVTRGQEVERVVTKEEPVFSGLRLAVLVDGESASASEIFASAIQAHSLGVVVGSRTYGKGSIQTVVPIAADGGSIKMTIGFYRDPLDRRIEGVGVEPTIVVATDSKKSGRPRRGEPDPALSAALEWVTSGEEVPAPRLPRPELGMDKPL